LKKGRKIILSALEEKERDRTTGQQFLVEIVFL